MANNFNNLITILKVPEWQMEHLKAIGEDISIRIWAEKYNIEVTFTENEIRFKGSEWAGLNKASGYEDTVCIWFGWSERDGYDITEVRGIELTKEE